MPLIVQHKISITCGVWVQVQGSRDLRALEKQFIKTVYYLRAATLLVMVWVKIALCILVLKTPQLRDA